MDRCDGQKDKLLRDYFMNRLSADETEAFQFHLFQCQRCQDKLRRMRQLAHGEEEAATAAAATDRTNSSEHKHDWRLAAWMRVAALIGLLFVLAAGGYFYMSTPTEEEWTLQIDEAPALHAGDSVQAETDSVRVDVTDREKEDGYVE